MAINHTDTEDWTVEDIISALSDTPSKKDKILIPKFQRTLVWNKVQKKMFIDSIKQGFPVGAILLYKSSHDQSGNTIYNLIDGLQRSTALNQYIKSPTQFFDDSNLSEEFIYKTYNTIKNEKNDIDKDELIANIVKWVTSLKGFSEQKGFSSYQLVKYLEKELSFDFSKEKMDELVTFFIPFIEDIKSEANINQFKIPILIYTGNQNNLPSIFERLNSKGTQLSKYQIYAATWIHYKSFQIKNREIINGIKNKYDSLLEEGYDVEGFDSSPKFYTTDFTAFEYLFGLGKYLCNEFEYLFSGTSKAEQEDSIGFNLMNICLGLSFNEMDSLPEKFLTYDTTLLEEKIITSVRFVFDCLKGHIGLKMNKRTKVSIVHSELQIVSMIGKAFHSQFDENLNEKEDWQYKKELLKKNLPYHYLYDNLKEYWKGSGDTKAFNLISSEKYEKEIKKSNWENALTEWFENELEKKEKVRTKINEVAILFYKYIYCYSMSAYEEISSINYDIEHIVPVDKLKEISQEKGLPISAFPNLCLLDERLNRKKGSFTFYQYFDEKISNGELTYEQADIEIKKVECYTHTTKAELEFVSEDFSEENYINFLNTRFQKIKELFIELNGITE